MEGDQLLHMQDADDTIRCIPLILGCLPRLLTSENLASATDQGGTYPASRTANCYDMAPLPTSWYIHTLIWSAECRMENREVLLEHTVASIGRAMVPMLLHSSCRPHLHEKMEYPGL